MRRNKVQFDDLPSDRVWVPVSDHHAVSDQGEVYSLIYDKFLAFGMGTNGRPSVSIRRYQDKRCVSRGVHVIVCEAFHGPRPAGKNVSHLNGDMLDNRQTNLAWETQKKNLARRREHGTLDNGLNNSRACLTQDDLTWIFEARAAGWTQQRIADHLTVSRPVISRVLSGKRYGEDF